MVDIDKQISNTAYVLVEDLIDSLSPIALNELLSGNENDLGKMLDVLHQLYIDTLMLTDFPAATKVDGLVNLYEAIDMHAMIKIYNYFKVRVMDDITQYTRNIMWGNIVQYYKRATFICGRGTGKTTEFSYAFILWRLWSYVNRRNNRVRNFDNELRHQTLLVTFETRLVTTLAQRIIEAIKNNEILEQKINPNNKAKLGVEGIIGENGAMLHIRTMGGFSRGLHVGGIVCDDVLTDANIWSIEQRNKVIEFFYGVIMYMYEKGGYLVTVGTPFHEKDLYHRHKQDGRFLVTEWPIIMPDGTLLAPDRYSYQDIKIRREEDGPLVFAREALVSPITDSTSLFPSDLLERSYKDMTHVTLVHNRESFFVELEEVIVGCDFAISGSINADFTAYTVWGRAKNGVCYLLSVFHERGVNHNEQIAQLHNYARQFKPDRFVLESNNFQKLLSDLAKQDGIKNIEEWVTTGVNKKDLKSGLPSLVPLFERGIIKIPYGDENSRKVAQWLCSEFNSMTYNQDKGTLESSADHDDGVMSSFIALNKLLMDKNDFKAYYI